MTLALKMLALSIVLRPRGHDIPIELSSTQGQGGPRAPLTTPEEGFRPRVAPGAASLG